MAAHPAVGYVRSNDRTELAAADRCVRAFAQQQGYQVSDVFHDDAPIADEAHVKAFAAVVLREVRRRGVRTVIVCSPADLSQDAESRLWLNRMIRRQGAELAVAGSPALAPRPGRHIRGEDWPP